MTTPKKDEKSQKREITIPNAEICLALDYCAGKPLSRSINSLCYLIILTVIVQLKATYFLSINPIKINKEQISIENGIF